MTNEPTMKIKYKILGDQRVEVEDGANEPKLKPNQYRKKPIVIDAVQWNGDMYSWHNILDMGLNKWKPGEIGTETFIIETLEGEHLARKGDWIIKGVQGEFYPCKPDIFKATYEKAETRQKIDVGEIEKVLWSAEACIADGLLSGKGVTKEYGQTVIQEIRECRKSLAEHFEGKGESND